MVEAAPAIGPGLVSRAELRVTLQGPDLRLDLLDEATLQRKDHTERLVVLEGDRDELAGEFPVHREAKGSPIGFDHTGKWLNAVLGLVQRAGHHQIVAGFRPKQ